MVGKCTKGGVVNVRFRLLDVEGFIEKPQFTSKVRVAELSEHSLATAVVRQVSLLGQEKLIKHS